MLRIIIIGITFIILGIVTVTSTFYSNRWYLKRHAKRLGIKPGLLETDNHLRGRIMNKIMNK